MMSFLLIETLLFEPAYDDMKGADRHSNTATRDQGEKKRPSPVIWICKRPSTVAIRQNKNANAHCRA